jgi:hypothetical protein
MVTAQQAYQQLLTTLAGHTGSYAGINEFWSGSARTSRSPRPTTSA